MATPITGTVGTKAINKDYVDAEYIIEDGEAAEIGAE